jgi:hypothetical protein
MAGCNRSGALGWRCLDGTVPVFLGLDGASVGSSMGMWLTSLPAYADGWIVTLGARLLADAGRCFLALCLLSEGASTEKGRKRNGFMEMVVVQGMGD